MASSATDEYARRARYVPGLLAFAPLWVVVLAAGWQDAKIVAGLVGLAGTVGLPAVLQSFVRQRGKQYDEDKLPGSEGRFATTRMLLPGRDDPATDAHNAQRRGIIVAATGIRLDDEWPTDPARQHEVVARIDSAVAAARAATRDRDRFWLLAADNADYGMWRNLYGMRAIGIGVACLALIVTVVLALLSAVDALELATSGLVLGAVVVTVLGALWFVVPTQDRIRIAAASYATALFDAALLLRAEPTRQRDDASTNRAVDADAEPPPV